MRNVVLGVLFGAFLQVPAFAQQDHSVVDSRSYRDSNKQVDYKPVSALLQKAWLELYRLPDKNAYYYDRQNLRLALEHIYRVQGRAQEANFIRRMVEPELAEVIVQIDKGERTFFPKMIDGDPVYGVTKQRSGTLNFSPIGACIGHFSITRESTHYAAACKHVGELPVGEVKYVPEVPFRSQLTSDDMVLKLDPQ